MWHRHTLSIWLLNSEQLIFSLCRLHFRVSEILYLWSVSCQSCAAGRYVEGACCEACDSLLDQSCGDSAPSRLLPPQLLLPCTSSIGLKTLACINKSYRLPYSWPLVHSILMCSQHLPMTEQKTTRMKLVEWQWVTSWLEQQIAIMVAWQGWIDADCVFEGGILS